MSQNPFYIPSARTPRACSYCGKVFGSLYALGGHMTAHRTEMEQTRREHRASVKRTGTNGADVVAPSNNSGNFWQPPPTVDFLGLGAQLLEKDGDVSAAMESCCELKLWSNGDHGAEPSKVREGKRLDLSLKL